MRIEARGLGWVLIAESLGDSLRLTQGGADTPEPDAAISGSLMSLAALAGPDPEAVIQRGDVSDPR